MGTNFYFFTKDKEIKNKYFDESKCELADNPEFGYKLHIAKTSMGWLPLFEASQFIESVKDIKTIYDTGLVKIYDEYDTEYNWDEFKKRVLEFNGGTVSKRVLKLYVNNKKSPFYDPNMPSYLPISHFEYKPIKEDPSLLSTYYTDPEGYEFNTRWFS